MRVLSSIFIHLLFLGIQFSGYSQSLDDFKTASEKEGAESIPFGDLRRNAGAIQNDINSWKEKIASFKSWGDYEGMKNVVYKSIKKENETIKDRENYVKELKSRNVDASQFEKELETNYARIKQYNDELSAMNSEISKAVDAWDRLERLRGGQRETFDDVLSRLSNAKSSPDTYLGSDPTEENKKKLGEYIDKIVDHIKKEAEQHAIAEKEAANARDNMEKVLAKSSE